MPWADDGNLCVESLPRGSIVVPFWGSYLESYKVIPKSTTVEPMGSFRCRSIRASWIYTGQGLVWSGRRTW